MCPGHTKPWRWEPRSTSDQGGTSSFMCLQVTLKISGQGWKDPQALDAPIPHTLHPPLPGP